MGRSRPPPPRSRKRTRLSAGLWTEAVLHRAALREALEQLHRIRHVADHRGLVAEMAVAGQLELQGLRGDRVKAAKRPVLTAEPGPDFLHQVQGPLVLAANEVALRGGFKSRRPRLGISAHELRAVDV